MINIWHVSILSDNYVWIIQESGCNRVAVVDPGVAGPVLDELGRRGLEVGWVLLTHHHGDHVGGVGQITSSSSVPVYGPDQITGVTHPVAGDDHLHLEDLDLQLEVIHTPGHTLSHLVYTGPGFALVGDTLFAGGCGRLFEGTPAQMLQSLDGLAELPRDTNIYCAHEYTTSNLEFASLVEPDSAALSTRLAETRVIRQRGEPTVPSNLELELTTNPFLRSREPSVVAAASQIGGRTLRPGVETFTAIRAWKDRA